MEIVVTSVRKCEYGKMVGFASVELRSVDGNITINGIKIFNGTNGLFVGMPAEKDKKDEKKWWPQVVLQGEIAESVRHAVCSAFENPPEVKPKEVTTKPKSDEDIPF